MRRAVSALRAPRPRRAPASAAVVTTGMSKPMSSRVPAGSVPSCADTTSAVSRTTSRPQLRQIVRPTRAKSRRR